MDGTRTLRRSPKHLNLRSAAGQLPVVNHPNAAKFTSSEISHSRSAITSVPVSATCKLFNATPKDLVPKPLTPNNKGSNRDTTVPFPAFDDDLSANLLELAVQIPFNTIDWAGSFGPRVKSERAVSPRTSTAALVARRKNATDLLEKLHGSVTAPIVPGSTSHRNAIVVLQVSDQNGLTVSTHESHDKTKGETAMLLTMHGFAYDLRPPHVTPGKQERSFLRSKMATLKSWWRRMMGR